MPGLMGNSGKPVRSLILFKRSRKMKSFALCKKTLFKFVAFFLSPKQGEQGPEGEAGPTGPRGPPVSIE